MLKFDAAHYPYPSRRSAVYANRGMVATSQPLAAQAGLAVLQAGGNAIDAAIASGEIYGGMIPKVESAVLALAQGVKKVHFIDGRMPHSLLLEIFTNTGIGTEIVL
jgi:gamma-glutamyltranspeptidase/glutathione hydrolase